MRLFIFFATFLNLLSFCCVNVFATSLEEYVENAFANNKNIQYQDYKLKIVKAKKGEAIAEFLPNISANVNYGNKKNDISGDNQNFSNKERVEELRLEQSIFNGFGSVAKYNEANYAVKSEISNNQDKRYEIMMLAVNSYCDLYLFQKIQDLYQENYQYAISIENLAKKRKDSRIIDNSELVKFNYEKLEIEQEYFDIKNKFLNAKEEFLNIANVEYKNLIEPKTIEKQFNYQEILQNSLANNQQVKAVYYNYLSAKSAHNVEKSKFAPSVSVIASVNKQSNVVYLNQADLRTEAVYLNLSVPIFQKGVEYANISKSSNAISAAKKEYEIALDNLKKEVAKSLDYYELALNLLHSNQALEELAKNKMLIYQKKSRQRIVDRIEFLQAKIDYNKRISKTIEAKMNLIKAYYKIKYYLSQNIDET